MAASWFCALISWPDLVRPIRMLIVSHKSHFAGIFVAIVLALPAQASNLAREKRMADEIIDAILDGEAIDLKADNAVFLGIYTEAETAPPRGGAIILHGRGYHPDWQNVVSPLRTALPQEGWRTLSLQMPVLAKNAKYYDYLPILHEAHPRIEAGIDYLKEKGTDRIILIAHSCSVHMSMDWIEKTGDSGIDAYIGIGMGATDYQQPMARPFPLRFMEVPILDIFGTNDYPAVLQFAPRRKAMFQHPDSRQVVVEGADHYFTNRDDALVTAVSDWLDSLHVHEK